MKLIFTLLIFLLVALQYRLWFSEGSWMEVKQLKDKIAQQEQENKRLQERNSILMAEVKQLNEGTEAIEEKARSDLGMIKQGETFYLLVDDAEQNLVQ